MSDIIIVAMWLVVVVLVFWIVAFILRLLWNSTLPDVFGTSVITTWQALKLILIAAVLLSPLSARNVGQVTSHEPPARVLVPGADVPGSGRTICPQAVD